MSREGYGMWVRTTMEMNILTADRTNLDQGSVMGKTITTDIKTGSLIVAIVAIVSTLGTRIHVSIVVLF